MSRNDHPRNAEGDTTPLFWNRMLRFSLYFTILGVGLGFILGKMVSNSANDSKAQMLDQVKPGITIEQVDANGIPLENQMDINATEFSPAEWMGLPENHDVHGDAAGKMIDRIETFMVFIYVAPFLLLGVLSVLMCLFMRGRERKSRQDLL